MEQAKDVKHGQGKGTCYRSKPLAFNKVCIGRDISQVANLKIAATKKNITTITGNNNNNDNREFAHKIIHFKKL